jgi:hypothetical protein
MNRDDIGLLNKSSLLKNALRRFSLFYALACTFIFFCEASWANSVTLMNNSTYTLQATIYDANGTLLGEFVLNPNDATLWSDDDENWGTETQYTSQIPYTINWMCMNGSAYGTCNNVAAGSVVTAQSCGGTQECQQQQQQSPYGS